MLANEHNSLAQREMLVRPIFHRLLKRSVSHADGACRCHGPANMVGVPVPQLDAVAHVRDVVQVGVRELSQQLVHAEIELRGAAPKLAALRTQLLQQTQRMELAALVFRILTHGEQKKNIPSRESSVMESAVRD